MITPPMTLRLSAQERAWLVWLKGKTGVATANVLLRFALALSLREPSPPGVQPLPTDGLEIDHVCKVRNCVNPDHLRAVTRAENLATRASAQAHKTPFLHHLPRLTTVNARRMADS